MENNQNNVGIIGLGHYIPEKYYTNFDIEKMVETSDEWIVQRTGISKRHVISDGIPAYTMAVHAAKQALETSGVSPEELDLILVTSYNPDYLSPLMASLVQREIGAKKAATFDMNAVCSGYVYGIITASQFIASGYYKKVMVVNCEAQSRLVDWKDRNTCILFGDGAAATILAAVPEGYGILSSTLGADGTRADTITVPCLYASEEDLNKRHSDHPMRIWLDGSEVMKFASRVMVSAIHTCLEKADMPLEKVDLIVPHQANIRIIDNATKKLGLPAERVFTNIHKYGNMSSASIPVALHEAWLEGKIKDGDNLVLVGFGGGLTWGSLLLKWYQTKK